MSIDNRNNNSSKRRKKKTSLIFNDYDSDSDVKVIMSIQFI
jgi:hypothetical protein